MKCETTLPTRQDYMGGKVTFEQFYESVAAMAGIAISEELVARVKATLANGDEHLNTIWLPMWDRLADENRTAITRALKAHGDFYSMAGGVCTMKAAARKAAQ